MDSEEIVVLSISVKKSDVERFGLSKENSALSSKIIRHALRQKYIVKKSQMFACSEICQRLIVGYEEMSLLETINVGAWSAAQGATLSVTRSAEQDIAVQMQLSGDTKEQREDWLQSFLHRFDGVRVSQGKAAICEQFIFEDVVGFYRMSPSGPVLLALFEGVREIAALPVEELYDQLSAHDQVVAPRSSPVH